jgi:uncharacterized protein YbjT (DUF2867 family)
MNTKLETILVTGSTGNVGSELIKQLSKDTSNVNVKAAVHSAKNAERLKGVDTVQIDYDRPETLKEALNGVDKVFYVPPESPNAIEHASNFVKEAKRAKIKHIVKLSASGVDNETVRRGSSSLRLHHQTEKIIEDSGIPFSFLRPGEFMQNFVNWDSPAIKEESVFWRVGNTKVSVVDVRDIAAVAVQALINNRDGRHNGKAYAITGPEALSYYQMAEILSNATGKRIDYRDIPKEEARHRLEKSGLSDWWIKVIMEVYDIYERGTQAQVSNAVEEVTGKRPRTFAQFAKDYVEFFN